jgi:hypothetical protein
MINNELIIEYKKLLEIGRKRIEGTTENDLEEHAETDKLLRLNEYVYTYYSTNEIDRTYSIEFVVLADYMDIILKELNEKGMWYCAKNYKTNEYIKKYDDELYNITEKIYRNITKEDLNLYDLKSVQYPNGWEVVTTNDKENMITISKDHKIHFLESTTIKEFNSMYNNSNYFLKMSFLPNTKDIVNIDLLSGNIAIIVVEDPEINRNTLYDELLAIFQEKIDFSRKSVDTKKGGRRKRSRKLNKKLGKQKAKRPKKSRKHIKHIK